jgi:hypothetical protein
VSIRNLRRGPARRRPHATEASIDAVADPRLGALDIHVRERGRRPNAPGDFSLHKAFDPVGEFVVRARHIDAGRPQKSSAHGNHLHDNIVTRRRDVTCVAPERTENER